MFSVCHKTVLGHSIPPVMAGGIWEFTAPGDREWWWAEVALDHPSVKED